MILFGSLLGDDFSLLGGLHGQDMLRLCRGFLDRIKDVELCRSNGDVLGPLAELPRADPLRYGRVRAHLLAPVPTAAAEGDADAGAAAASSSSSSSSSPAAVAAADADAATGPVAAEPVPLEHMARRLKATQNVLDQALHSGDAKRVQALQHAAKALPPPYATVGAFFRDLFGLFGAAAALHSEAVWAAAGLASQRDAAVEQRLQLARLAQAHVLSLIHISEPTRLM
jgi:hypothetical protein